MTMPIIIIQLLQILVPMILQHGPKAVADVKALLDKQEPTAADWEALRARPYESFNIPEAADTSPSPE
jgi:hypothetical protein